MVAPKLHVPIVVVVLVVDLSYLAHFAIASNVLRVVVLEESVVL